MNIIEKTINENRPNISKSSLKTYESILRNLYINVFESNDYKLKNFDNDEMILNYLKGLPVNKRKTILSALVVITDNKQYRDQMLDDIKEYNKNTNKQEKTEAQNENWVNNEDIMKIHDVLKKHANLLYKKDMLTMHDLQEIENYIILVLLGGIYIPPRRSKDFVDFKISNIDKDKDNYFDGTSFIFNSYKTAKTYGQQKVLIPKDLKPILKKWLKYNPTEYLLFDSYNNKLSNVKLNQRLQKIFGKKVGVNGLRHTYLSEKYGDLIDTKSKLAKDMSDMGSSMIQETTYIKKG
jgi:integrase